VRDLTRTAFALVFILVLSVLLAVAFGFTPDGILHGHLPESDDHPTNWNDSAQHP
jgi:hypothetical protein